MYRIYTDTLCMGNKNTLRESMDIVIADLENSTATGEVIYHIQKGFRTIDIHANLEIAPFDTSYKVDKWFVGVDNITIEEQKVLLDSINTYLNSKMCPVVPPPTD